jgi:hypothetical protein
MSWEQRRDHGDLAPRPPLYGVWDVEVFEADGELVPEDAEEGRWRRLYLGLYSARVDEPDGSMARFWAQAAPKGERFTLTMTRIDDPSWRTALRCEKEGEDRLTLAGPFAGRELRVELARAPEDPFLLTNRGFHWINEFPFNR